MSSRKTLDLVYTETMTDSSRRSSTKSVCSPWALELHGSCERGLCQSDHHSPRS